MLGLSHVEITFRQYDSDAYYLIIDEVATFASYGWQMEHKTMDEYVGELAAFLFDKSLVCNVVDCQYSISTQLREFNYNTYMTRIDIVLSPSDDGQTNIDADFIEILLKLLKPKFKV